MADVVRAKSATADRAVLSRSWHAVLALVIAVSLITQVVLLAQDEPDVNATETGPAVSLGVRFGRLLSYFTIESNLLVLAAAVTLALDPDRDGRIWRVLRLDALLGIVITGIVFATVLAGQVHHTGIHVWVNFGFHYFSPWWALAGWLLFGPRPRIGWSTVGWAFGWPAVWLLFTFVRGGITDWYPYPFLDAGDRGYSVAIRNAVLVVVVAAVIAAVLKVVDGRLRTVTR